MAQPPARADDEYAERRIEGRTACELQEIDGSGPLTERAQYIRATLRFDTGICLLRYRPVMTGAAVSKDTYR